MTVVDPHDLMTDVDLNELADEVATRLQAVIETMQRATKGGRDAIRTALLTLGAAAPSR